MSQKRDIYIFFYTLNQILVKSLIMIQKLINKVLDS